MRYVVLISVVFGLGFYWGLWMACTPQVTCAIDNDMMCIQEDNSFCCAPVEADGLCDCAGPNAHPGVLRGGCRYPIDYVWTVGFFLFVVSFSVWLWNGPEPKALDPPPPADSVII
jgi:hypothetical protein